ncbi:MAG TPA: exosortase-associated EpsI family protein [Fimbriimonadaceae bacterium]|nr:exosortase-associated EpsI family protein [Fimbriimonadaceae bacterium]HRJ32868.1 exosortase-associated EpsI family protein [Fimbriimonadaceae bacterium]
MERLIKRAYAFGFGLLLVGAGFTVMGLLQPPVQDKDEAWMEQRAPDTVEGMPYDPSNENPEQSYKMDQVTYDLLLPYGIVSRVYRSRDKAYDVVLIASRSKDSFHDPRICFTGQGWTLVTQDQMKAESKTVGTIPVSIVVMTGRTEADRNKVAAFFYKGPDGYVAGTNDVKWSMFKAEFLGNDNLDGVFYRVIPLHRPKDQESAVADVLDFIGKYIDAAHASSDGYF